MGLGKYGANLPKDPSKRTFAGLNRQQDGTFKDEELVGILTSAIEDVAGAFRFSVSSIVEMLTLLSRVVWRSQRAQGSQGC